MPACDTIAVDDACLSLQPDHRYSLVILMNNLEHEHNSPSNIRIASAKHLPST